MLLLGPIGVVALAALLVFGRRPGRVGGSVPLSEAALGRYNTSVLVGRWSFVLSLLVLAGGIAASIGFEDWRWAPEIGAVAMVSFAVGILVAVVAGVITRRLWIDGDLDGSGRWVALTGVHWVFAHAVEKRYRTAATSSASAPDD